MPGHSPGAPGLAQTLSYAPEGDTAGAQPRPQTTTEALAAAYRACAAEGVPAPGHRRMVRLVKRYLTTRRRIDERFAEWVIAYADPTGETAVRNVLREARR